MNDMDADTNRLTVDGTPFTPKGLQVREVLDVMLELADSGQTMLIVTHEMQFARAIADQVILLEDGGIVERSDDAERFFTNPTTERANSSCIRLNSIGIVNQPSNPNGPSSSAK